MASFKVECPACEAMVLIRDEGLIGRKIDCPKCKKRFVVEEPPEKAAAKDEEAAEPAKKDKAGAAVKDKITARKPTDGKAVVKAKPGPKQSAPETDADADADEGADESKPKKKGKKKNTSMLLIGGSLALAAIAALGVAGWAIFGGSPKSPSKPPAGPRNPGLPGKPTTPTPPAGTVPGSATDTKRDTPVLAVADITNLLPNDCQTVGSLSVEKARAGSVRQPLLGTPGSFSSKSFDNTFGIPLDDVSRIVFGMNHSNNGWYFAVMRTTKPFKQEQVTARLKANPQAPINTRDYYLLKGDLDPLSNLLFKGNTRRDAYALHFIDNQTLVLGDLSVMQKFLQANARPQFQSQVGANEPPPMTEKTPADPNPPPLGQQPPMPKDPPVKGPPGKGAKGPPRGGPNPPASGQPTKPVPPPPPMPSGSWLTVRAELKSVLDKLDKAEQPAIFCMAGEFGAMLSLAPLLESQIRPEGQAALGLHIKLAEPYLEQMKGAAVYGYGLKNFTEDKMAATHAVNLGSDELVKEVKKLLASNQASSQPGPNPPPNGQPNPPPPPKDDTVSLALDDRVFTAALHIDSKNVMQQTLRVEACNRGKEGLRALLIYLRGEAEMINTESRIFDLAEATQKYLKDPKKGHFPRGTLTPPDSDGMIVALPPQKRLSWMVDLLPYLNAEYEEIVKPGSGGEKLHVNFEKAWQEGDNLVLARLVVPQFIARGPGVNPAYRIYYPGTATLVAATHFVGIAGVGMDAPYYPMGDPKYAKKIGIFGYDRETKIEDIKDGPDKTILLIQVPLDHKAPWIAGGGSTVRGVSEEVGCFKPFVCAEYQGKKGTFAIMADGKVRFLPETLPPETFRALCTIAGGEAIENLDQIAPEVKRGANQAELKAVPGLPATPPEKPQPKTKG